MLHLKTSPQRNCGNAQWIHRRGQGGVSQVNQINTERCIPRGNSWRPYNNKPCRCHSRSKIRGKEIKTYGWRIPENLSSSRIITMLAQTCNGTGCCYRAASWWFMRNEVVWYRRWISLCRAKQNRRKIAIPTTLHVDALGISMKETLDKCKRFLAEKP